MSYEPNTWSTGDTITAEKLNRLEQGVSAAASAVDGAKSAATTSTAGVVKQMAHIEDLAQAPTQADFNGLLAALQTAGIMAAE